MWLGLDDTDSLDGGCTTLVFHQLLDALPCEYGEPRLTRLWPFAAQRTRGNASLSVELFCDESIIQWLEEYWVNNIAPLKGEVSESKHSDRKQYPSDPGMTLFPKKQMKNTIGMLLEARLPSSMAGINGEAKVASVLQHPVHGVEMLLHGKE